MWAEQVQRLQKWLLLTIQKDHPSAMYPAAICALADLIEVSSALQLLTQQSAGVRAAPCLSKLTLPPENQFLTS